MTGCSEESLNVLQIIVAGLNDYTLVPHLDFSRRPSLLFRFHWSDKCLQRSESVSFLTKLNLLHTF